MSILLIFIGTVSATYGTLIVLAISFAIAAIGNILTLPSLITCKTRGHTGKSCTLLLSGALLYYGLLSMREQRYSSSQYYPRYFNIMSGGSNWRAKNDFWNQASADETLRPGAGCQCPQTFAPAQHRVRAQVNTDLK